MVPSPDTLTVRDAKDVTEAVQAACAAATPLEIIGHSTKRDVGQPLAPCRQLDLSSLAAVSDYEPNELILTVQPGAPLADVVSLIDAKNQEFAFEPMDTSALLGTAPGRGTVGGMIAASFAGPRRVKAGAARDHLLGATAVSGRGEIFKAGGKVVKNVTGYDLCKLLAGSWGTLAVMTEVTLKVMPKAENEATLVLHGLDTLAANRAMTLALGSPFDVSGAAHVPASALSHDEVLAALDGGRKGLTLLRLEGIGASVAHRAKSLSAALQSFGAAETVAEPSRRLWAAIRDVAPFAASGPLGAWTVWRIVCPPAAGGELGQALARETGGDLIYDWGGGLIWLAMPPTVDAGAGRVRSRLEAHSAHASLVRASAEIRAGVDVFQPQSAGLTALSQRLKASFDPDDILNRGRMARSAGP